MYELRERPLLRCLLSPFENSLGFTLFVAAFYLLRAGGWITVGAAAYLVFFEVMSYRIRLRADESGIEVTNRFFRDRIPWALVVAVAAPDRGDFGNFIPTVVITTGKASISISVCAAMGMRRARRREVALALVDVARQHGYEIVGGSQAEVAAQLRAQTRVGGS